jgi:hypothetical protein
MNFLKRFEWNFRTVACFIFVSMDHILNLQRRQWGLGTAGKVYVLLQKE